MEKVSPVVLHVPAAPGFFMEEATDKTKKVEYSATFDALEETLAILIQELPFVCEGNLRFSYANGTGENQLLFEDEGSYGWHVSFFWDGRVEHWDHYDRVVWSAPTWKEGVERLVQELRSVAEEEQRCATTRLTKLAGIIVQGS